MAKSNDEMIANFMQFKSVFHHLFVINGLYMYSKQILQEELDLPEEFFKLPGFSPGEMKMCARDFITEYYKHCEQQR